MSVIQTSFPETRNTVFTTLLSGFRWSPEVFCSKFQINESGHKIFQKTLFLPNAHLDTQKGFWQIFRKNFGKIRTFWLKSQTDLKSLRVFHKKSFWSIISLVSCYCKFGDAVKKFLPNFEIVSAQSAK